MREDTPKNGVKMSVAATALRDQCAVRFRDAIRASVPSMARKKVANLLGTSPETVDGWIDNESPQIPSAKHLLASFAVFGPAFTAYVLAPCGNWAKSLSLEARAERLKREIDELKRELDAFDKVASPSVLDDQVRMALEKSQESLERAKAKK